MTYREWVRALLREHRHRQGYRRRCTGCWACDVLDVPETDRLRCKDLSEGAPGTLPGGFDGHHVLPQQVVKRQFTPGTLRAPGSPRESILSLPRPLDAYLYDVRIGVPLRRWHHDQWENRRLVVPRAKLPAGVEEIAGELGLGWWLDRTFS